MRQARLAARSRGRRRSPRPGRSPRSAPRTAPPRSSSSRPASACRRRRLPRRCATPTNARVSVTGSSRRKRLHSSCSAASNTSGGSKTLKIRSRDSGSSGVGQQAIQEPRRRPARRCTASRSRRDSIAIRQATRQQHADRGEGAPFMAAPDSQAYQPAVCPLLLLLALQSRLVGRLRSAHRAALLGCLVDARHVAAEEGDRDRRRAGPCRSRTGRAGCRHIRSAARPAPACDDLAAAGVDRHRLVRRAVDAQRRHAVEALQVGPEVGRARTPSPPRASASGRPSSPAARRSSAPRR